MKKLLLFFAIAICFSCKKNILDIPPSDRVSDAAVWTDANLIQAYENEMYNGLPHGFYIHMYSKYTDEAVNTAPCCGANIFGPTTYTPDNIDQAGSGDFWGGYMYYWTQGYVYIRKVNLFLEKMSTTTVSLPNKARLVAEAKFLRAFMYFNLIERFGGVPIVTQSYPLGTQVDFKRSSFDDCVTFIEKDIAEAIPDLPVSYASTDANFGRASQDACKALSSRVLLYAASPLFNTSNDMTKWQKAADAAASLLSSGYSLYPDYQKEFMLTSGSPNSELIFAREFTTTNGHQTPMNNLGRRYGAYGGWWGSNGPSQNLVDDYDMTNGQPPFITAAGGVKTINPASGYAPQHPYENRDPRFNATVIHDSTIFRGDRFAMWIAPDGKTFGMDSYTFSSDNPKGGYILKKFMPDDPTVPLSWQTTYTTPWPFFRLAEIYLNYAEAKLALGDEATCRQYINLVRARPSVNMPPIPASVTGDALKARLYNERRIELAFEGHRFFDVRRWKIAMDIENRPIMGMNISRDPATNKQTYTPVVELQKQFTPNMYLLPVATAELSRNKNLGQSAGW
ncbi:RagB/SusD family nutrient uptake outer membrane protein [Mucilaginibacter sp. AW1-7]|jgi:hypothetical protein|uniref:RagB/SusD family nutrient uptake outer membrane protein n=1 Tax=Mucilaginibacter sp. AW1-7 TaxID=3349874 RepID=UPI003F739292